MTDRQINVLEMYERVLKVLDTFQTIWKGNAKFKANQQTFLANAQAIEKWKGKQGTNTSGITEDKETLKKRLLKLTSKVAAGLQSYAADTADATLAAQANYSKSKLDSLRENLLPTTAQRLYELASTRVKDLKEDGITPELLAELKTTSDQFATELPDTQLAIGDTKTATATLPELFTQTNALLKNQLDTKMEQFEESNPDFYAAYFNARPTIHRGKSKSKPAVVASKNQ